MPLTPERKILFRVPYPASDKTPDLGSVRDDCVAAVTCGNQGAPMLNVAPGFVIIRMKWVRSRVHDNGIVRLIQ